MNIYSQHIKYFDSNIMHIITSKRHDIEDEIKWHQLRYNNGTLTYDDRCVVNGNILQGVLVKYEIKL